jgi:hypothetical protein
MNKNKTSIAIALFLMFAMTISIIALPVTSGQTSRITYPYIGATPNPVGVGQEVLLHVGITQQLSIVGMGWEGLSVTITRPDGTTETIRDLTTDSTGGTGTVFVPTVAGNYTLVTHFPEQVTQTGKTSPGITLGTIMLASTSEPLTLVVTDEPQQYWPDIPLPTEYWARPIDAQLFEWHTISGNWLRTYSSGGVPRFIPYNDDAPESAHILWAKPIAGGGLAGGLMGRDDRAHSYEDGAAYVPKFENGIVIAGVLYYDRFESRGQPYAEQEVVAVDLKTGEELWVKPLIGRISRPGTTANAATVAAANRVIDGFDDDRFPDGIARRLYMGQVFYWDSYNYHGVYGLLWTVTGSTWMAFDAHTGRWIYTIENVPSGTTLEGVNGEILRLQVNRAQGWMALWNSSNLVSQAGSWNPHGNIYNASGTGAGPTRAWEWNVTMPTSADLPGSVNDVFYEDMIVGSNIPTGFGGGVSPSTILWWGISLKPGEEGRLLFNRSWTPPSEWVGNLTIRYGLASAEDKVALLWTDEREWWAFSLEDGRHLWNTEPEHYLHIYGSTSVIGYGKLYSCYMSGIIYSYDIQTGDRLWVNDYSARDTLGEVLWSTHWPMRIYFLADGKLYLITGEHSPVDPKPRGGPMICVDAETGEELWRLDGMWFYYRANPTMGDSVISILNSYDNRIYTIGKGPSAMTTSIQNDVTTHGNKVLVTGKVTDVSPGTRDSALSMRFPSGVPAVADESMNEWMQYVYMQLPRPTDVVGVEVVVSVLDPNNNHYEVARTTADADGFFSVDFEPEVPGKYTVIAAFEGSKAYYGSHAKIAVSVMEAPAPPPEATPPPASIADTYFVHAVVGIIVAIAIGFALVLLTLRKR